MLIYLFLSFGALALSLAITPLVRLLAIRTRVLDKPSERKVHGTPIPLLGGVGIFMSFNVTLLLGYALFGASALHLVSKNWYTFLVCEAIILGLGIYDDIKRLSPQVKLFFQIIVGFLIVLSGFGIESISNPLSGKIVHLGFFAVPLTVIWLVGITNGLNLVDGLDGLAAGTALLVSSTIFAISFIQQNMTVGFLALTLAGSVLGFLKYNFFPARIFLGDSGSLLLGFILAVLSIQGSSKGATLVAVLAPILVLGLPIMDTLLSMLRRFLKSLRVIRKGDNKRRAKIFFSMFEADKDHIHHRLLKMGFSHRTTVIILYASSAALCVLAFLSVALQNLNVVAFLVAVLIVMLVGIKNLNYQEFKILQNGFLFPLFQIPIVGKKIFPAFYDLCAIALSYSLSYLLSIHAFGAPSKAIFIRTVAFIILFKMGAFYLAGIYKGAWILTGFEDFLSMFKTIFITSLISSTGLILLFGTRGSGGLIFFMLDFFLLISFVIGFRISFRVVGGLYRQSLLRKDKKVLVYGAGKRGLTVIQEIRDHGAYLFTPIGFIDDDSNKIGQVFDGCPVLGTIEDLDTIMTKNPILEIIISTEKISRDKIGRLIDFCKEKGIILRQFVFRFYEFPIISDE